MGLGQHAGGWAGGCMVSLGGGVVDPVNSPDPAYAGRGDTTPAANSSSMCRERSSNAGLSLALLHHALRLPASLLLTPTPPLPARAA